MTQLLIRLFLKNAKDINDPKVRDQYGQFASGVGIATNVFLFLIKLISGIVFNSIAIIADAINNLSDSVASLVTLIGFKISGKPADSEHPYGHARVEYIAGMIVSFSILFLGINLVQSAFEKIIHPENANFNLLTVCVLIISILVKLWQSVFYRKIGQKMNSITLIAVSIDSRNDIIVTTSILLGTVITLSTGLNLDGYMGMLVALFIIYSAFRLILDTTDPLLGLAPSDEMVEAISSKILNYEHIIGIHDLQVHSYGAGRCYASVHCEVPAEFDVMVSHDIIDQIERDFQSNDHIQLVIHMDPVITNDEKTNGLKTQVEALVNEISPELQIHDFRVIWGIHTTKVIFDVVIPYKNSLKETDIIACISKDIQKLDPNYQTIVLVERG